MPVQFAHSEEVLARLLAWGASRAGFSKQHARDALFVAEGWSDASGGLPSDDMFLLALPICFTVWIDDRSDRYLREATSPIDWEALFSFVETGAPPNGAMSVEVEAFDNLSTLLARRARHPEEHALWRVSSSRMLHAMHFEERSAKGFCSSSFAECIELGAYSTGIEMILMGAYLVLGINRPARTNTLWLPDAERYMCIYQRLLNDLHSAAKERLEVVDGTPSNATLLMEGTLTQDAARKWVRTQADAYRGLTDECFRRLGFEDPCVKIICDMRRQVDSWYEKSPERYEV